MNPEQTKAVLMAIMIAGLKDYAGHNTNVDKASAQDADKFIDIMYTVAIHADLVMARASGLGSGPRFEVGDEIDYASGNGLATSMIYEVSVRPNDDGVYEWHYLIDSDTDKARPAMGVWFPESELNVQKISSAMMQ